MKNLLSDIDILETVTNSETVRETLGKLYENKNPPSSSYRRISKLMIENGVKFKNGKAYVHPSLQSLYEENKDKKPTIKFKKV